MVIRFPRERGRAEIVLFVSGAYLALIYDQDRRGPDLGTMAVGRMTYFFIGLPIVPQFGLLIDHEGARLKLLANCLIDKDVPTEQATRRLSRIALCIL